MARGALVLLCGRSQMWSQAVSYPSLPPAIFCPGCWVASYCRWWWCSDTPRGAKRRGMRLRWFTPGGSVSGFLAGMVGAVGPLLASFYLGYGLMTAAFIGTSSLSVIIVHLPRLAGYGSLDLTHPRHRCRHRADRFPRGLHREPDATPRICGSFPSIVQIVLIATGILFIVRG